MLGRDDMADEEFVEQAIASNMGFADKIIGSLVSSLMKNFDTQLRELHGAPSTEIKSFPNGIKIKIGPQQKKKEAKIINKPMTEEQLVRIASLPRTEAKTNVRRMSDKVVYEVLASGIESADDVIVSKLESGYEIKAIGKNKVYVNSIPINLPMKGFSLSDKGLIVEFI